MGNEEGPPVGRVLRCGGRLVWQAFLTLSLWLAALPVVAGDLQLLSHPLDPFTMPDGGERPGLAVELVQAMAGLAGDHAEISIVPFPRLLAAVQRGPNLGAFIVSRTSEREATLQWVGPLIVSGVYVYVKADAAFQPLTLEDLRRLDAIGVQTANADDAFLSEHGFTNLDRRKSQASTLLGLELGRVSAAPMAELVFSALVKSLGFKPEDFVRTPIKLYDARVYLAFSKDIDPARVARWSAALEALKNSGSYDAILERYSARP